MDIRDWKMLQIVVSAPLFLLLLLYFVLPESPRWLIATGRYKEAKELIEKAAKMNKVSNSLRANWGYSLNASKLWYSTILTILQWPFFNLLHKIIRFSDIMQFNDNFCGDQSVTKSRLHCTTLCPQSSLYFDKNL